MANDISPQLLAQRYFEEAESDTLRLKSGTSLAVDDGTGTSVGVGPGVFDAGTLTIASGVVTLPAVPAGTAIIRATIDTEAAASTDDVDSFAVASGTVAIGTSLVLKTANNNRDVTFVASASALVLDGATSVTLGTSNSLLVLSCAATNAQQWRHVANSTSLQGLAWASDPTNLALVFNENGSAAADLRVESDTKSSMIFVDASADAVGINNATPTGYLHIGAGSTAAGAAPLKLTTGSLLITPEAGAVEYLTNIPYFTGATSQRGIVDTSQFVFQSAAFVLPNNNSLNSCFTAAQDTFTVQAATTYILDAWINLTTGATTHTTAFGLLGAGATTTFTSINILASCTSAATGGGIAAPQESTIKVATAQVLDVTSTAVDTHIKLSGSFQVNAAGTIIPSIQFSADPTGTCQTNIGSYFRITPIGSNTVTSVGPWA